MQNGLCRMHNGNGLGGRPITTGRYSAAHRASLQEKIDQYLADPDPANLDHEIALLRALLQDFLSRFTEDSALSLDAINALYQMVEGVARNVERVSRIFNETALTQAEVQLLQARFADLLVKYVPDNRLDDALGEAERTFHVRERSALTGSGTERAKR